MALSYKFAIIRLAPEDGRDERLNIGAIVFNDKGLDIHWARRLDKVRAISAGVDTNSIRDLVEGIRRLDAKKLDSGTEDAQQRLDAVRRLGPISLSELGSFVANDSDAYQARVAALLKHLVDAEPAPRRVREKRSRLLTQLKKEFRRERILAQKDETIDSHRIVAGLELDEGLVADLALKNGAMHIIETVDASSEDEAARTAIAGVGVAALVLERARMRFGESQTKARLVYSASAMLEKVTAPALEAAHNQGAELINWHSQGDRGKFLAEINTLAEPRPRKRRSRSAGGSATLFQ